MTFEEFTERGRRSGKIPKITITKAGVLTFNKVFVEKYLSDKKLNAIFYYGRKYNTIWLGLIDKPQKNSYKIRITQGGLSAVVSARAFLKYYDIPFEKTHAYKAHCVQGKLMIIPRKKNEK